MRHFFPKVVSYNRFVELGNAKNLNLNGQKQARKVTIPKFTLHFFDTLLKNSTDKISLTKRLYILPLQR